MSSHHHQLQLRVPSYRAPLSIGDPPLPMYESSTPRGGLANSAALSCKQLCPGVISLRPSDSGFHLLRCGMQGACCGIIDDEARYMRCTCFRSGVWCRLSHLKDARMKLTMDDSIPRLCLRFDLTNREIISLLVLYFSSRRVQKKPTERRLNCGLWLVQLAFSMGGVLVVFGPARQVGTAIRWLGTCRKPDIKPRTPHMQSIYSE